MDDKEYSIDPRIIERLVWALWCIALFAVPFAGLALDAPLAWYVGAPVYLAAAYRSFR